MSALNIKPLSDRVLVKRSKATASKGGILLPESAQERPKEGEVVAVGPGKYDDSGKLNPLRVKVGEKILFGSYAGTEIKTETADEEYLILSEDEILGVLVTQ